MKVRTKASLPSGFPEFLPEEQMIFEEIKKEIEKAYKKYGAVPIETPAIEKLEVLMAKGGEQKEMYSVQRAKGDNNESKMGLHFDLTVPLARYVSEHYNDIIFPFKRYQIQPVWRGERPQKGRYRQFYQADIDVIDRGELPLIYDAEMPAAVYEALTNIGVYDIQIHINNRKIIDSLLHYCKIDITKSSELFSLIDELFSLGKEVEIDEFNSKFLDLGVDASSRVSFLEFFEKINNLNNNEILNYLHELSNKSIFFKDSVNELVEVYSFMQVLGIPKSKIVINLRIVRGLDYYTGTVYETQLLSEPSLGSICSGGRYDNLVGTFSNRSLPGVGISIGLSRLVNVLMKRDFVKIKTTAQVFIANLNNKYLAKYNEIANVLRKSNINVEVMMDSKKLNKQLAFAHKKGYSLILLIGDNEIDKNQILVKKMKSGQQLSVNENQIVSFIKTHQHEN